MNRICLILSLTLIIHNCFSQEIVNDVVGNSGNQISNSTITIDNTSGELVTTTISNSQITLTQGFQQTSRLLYLSPKAILQGASIGTSDGLMRDNLRTGNYLPTTSPYNTNTNQSNNAFAVSGDDAIVDWVTIKLRNSDNRIITEKSALLQRDGDIVSADGVSPLQLAAQNKDYFVEVNHRNHLGTMTKDPISLSTTPTLLDFTDGSLLTYGNNARVQLASSNYALWAGDVSKNQEVKFSGANNDSNPIKSLVLNHPGNFFNFLTYAVNGYNNEDVNLDGSSRFSGGNNDSNIIKGNILAHPGNFFNFLTYSINSTTPPNN